jgi:hypothetical protein
MYAGEAGREEIALEVISLFVAFAGDDGAMLVAGDAGIEDGGIGDERELHTFPGEGLNRSLVGEEVKINDGEDGCLAL